MKHLLSTVALALAVAAVVQTISLAMSHQSVVAVADAHEPGV